MEWWNSSTEHSCNIFPKLLMSIKKTGTHYILLFLLAYWSLIHQNIWPTPAKVIFGHELKLPILLQKWYDQRIEVYTCFIDYQKTFDYVVYEKLIDIFEKWGANPYNLWIITNQYLRQLGVILIDGEELEDIQICRKIWLASVFSDNFLKNPYKRYRKNPYRRRKFHTFFDMGIKLKDFASTIEIRHTFLNVTISNYFIYINRTYF